jgi:ribosomal-protein-alanine N-acetyltransferase
MPRSASQADVAVLAAIHAAAFSDTDAWSRDVFDLQLALPNVLALLDEAGGLILMRVAANEAEVLTLAVTPGARRGGIGYILLTKGIAVVRQLGARAVFLEVSVANIAARALYTKAGFTEVGRRPHYYSDQSDALVLRLDLGDTPIAP